MEKMSTERKQSVCIIGKYLYPIDTRMVQQVKVLRTMGIHVDVLSLRGKGESSIERMEGLTIYRLMAKEPKENFAKYILSTVSFGLLANWRLVRLLYRKRISIVIVHTLPEYLLLFVAWVRLFGTRRILDGRDLTVDLLKSRWNGIAVTLLKPLAVILERLVASLCCEIITASNGFKRALIARKIKENKITVIFNTADTSVFTPVKNRSYEVGENGQLRLIYHGTVAPRFGVIVAIKALACIRKNYPGVVLFIHGMWDSAYKREIDKVIKSNALENHVRFNGVVSIEEINKLLQTVHLGIVPYLSDPFMNKALSTKTFEYIAAGLPVVASRLDSCTELFDDDCIHYAEPGNAKDLADKIIELARNSTLQKKKATAALKTFQHYTDTVMGQRFKSLVSKYL